MTRPIKHALRRMREHHRDAGAPAATVATLREGLVVCVTCGDTAPAADERWLLLDEVKRRGVCHLEGCEKKALKWLDTHARGVARERARGRM